MLKLDKNQKLKAFSKQVFGTIGWEALSQKQTISIIQAIIDRRLQRRDLELLGYLLVMLSSPHFVLINQAEMARLFKMKRHNVNRSLKHLIQEKLIEEGQRIGRIRTYRIRKSL